MSFRFPYTHFYHSRMYFAINSYSSRRYNIYIIVDVYWLYSVILDSILFLIFDNLLIVFHYLSFIFVTIFDITDGLGFDL